MKSVLTDLTTALTFDLVRLPDRLRKIDDPGDRKALVIFTVVSDAARCFLATVLYALVA